jgi:rRNA maturation protein Nop10
MSYLKLKVCKDEYAMYHVDGHCPHCGYDVEGEE